MNGGKRKLNAYQLFVKKYMNSMSASEKSGMTQPQIMKKAAAAYRAQKGSSGSVSVAKKSKRRTRRKRASKGTKKRRRRRRR